MVGLAKSSAVFLLLALGACASAPPPEPVPVLPTVPPGIDPLTGQPIDLTPGLNEREPDTCKLVEVQHLNGLTGVEVGAAGITRPFRMVPLGGIVSQEDYNPARVNFYTDAMGRIVRITCG